MKKHHRVFWILSLSSLIVFQGCGEAKSTHDAKQSDQNSPVVLTKLSPVQEKQKARANLAKKQLFESLVAELMKSLTENGASRSIKVCKEVAPRIAKKVSEDNGLKIGRTSFKLRNPENKSPLWAQSFVTKKVESDVAVELPNGSLGVLSPIRLKDACILCHGTKEQIGPDVEAALMSNYPKDQATGFAVGDIRGYFWMEVPDNNKD